MITPARQSQSDPRTCETRFMDCLRDIEQAGQLLQTALFQRKTDAIWQAIDLQEAAMRQFALCYKEYYAGRDASAPPISETDSLIGSLARKIKAIYRTNRALAHSFLDVIDRTLAGLNALQGGNPFVYDASGRIGQINGPMLVQQKG